MNILKEYTADGFTYSSDRTKIDIAYVHRIASTELYWAKGIPFDTVKRSVENSLSFGIYTNGKQVGFARLVTDYATFGYLADVFVDEQYRGRGLSKTLMEFIFGMDELKGFRRTVLVTRDAHTLYERYGFTSLKTPDTYMELHRPQVYSQV